MPALDTDGLTTQHLASHQGLQDHYDVASGTPNNGDVLAWNGSAWAPTAAGGGGSLDSLSDVTITSAAASQTLRHNGTVWVNTSSLTNDGTVISAAASGGYFDVPAGVDGTYRATSISDTSTHGATYLASRARVGPAALATNDVMTGIYARGYHSGAGYGNYVGVIRILAAEAFTATAQGTYIEFYTTATGATSRTLRGTIQAGGSWIIPGAVHVTNIVRSKFGTKGSSNDEHFQFGKTTSPAASDPYYVFKSTADAVPRASFEGWDGTTTRQFFRADHAGPSLTLMPSAGAVVIGTDPTGSELLRVGGGARFTTQVVSTLATGTAPFSIASTTLVTNLNADMLDGNHSSAFASSTHVHDTSDITTGTFADARIAQSNVTQHQAALSITEGQIANGSIYARLADAENISGAWIFQNAAGAKVQHGTEAQWRMEKTGASANLSYFFNNGTTLGLFDSTNTRTPWHYTISGNTLTITSPLTTPAQITSTLATGTAPFSIASTTVVTNLNADTVDGQHASAFAVSGHVHDAGTDITTGTLDEQRGGTGNNAYVTGDILYASSAFVLARLAKGTSGMFLKQGASIPAWATLTAADIDSGTFPGSSGYTFTSTVITNASAAGGAGFRLPHGAAPTAPTNGDFWTTTGGLFARINGATVTLATSANAVITNPSGAQTIVAASTSSASYPLELQGFGSSGAFQNNDSPPFLMRGYYWDGAASQPLTWAMAAIVTGAPTPTNTLTFKADGTARFTVTDAGKGWLGGPWVVGSDDGPPVGVNTQEVVAHDNTRQIGIGVDTTRGLVGMRSNHEFSFMTNNTRRWTVDASGNLIPVADYSYELGAVSSARLLKVHTRNLALGGSGTGHVGLIHHIGEYDNGTSGAGAKTVDWTNGNVQKITATGTATISFTAPTGPTTLVLRIIANSTTAYTFTWPATVKWAGGVSAPASPTTSGQWIMVTLYYDGTNYTGAYTGNTG